MHPRAKPVANSILPNYQKTQRLIYMVPPHPDRKGHQVQKFMLKSHVSDPNEQVRRASHYYTPELASPMTHRPTWNEILMEAKIQQPWLCVDSNAHTPDSRSAFLCNQRFPQLYSPNRNSSKHVKRNRLDKSSSARGIEKTAARFHHPRCLAVGGNSDSQLSDDIKYHT